jgi:hypothetical protein
MYYHAGARRRLQEKNEEYDKNRKSRPSLV